jgi:hypothetical protein
VKKNVVVVIPVYQPMPNFYEDISLRRCFEKLSSYEIVFVAPENLNMKNYEKYGVFRTESFDNKWFVNVKAYSNLLTNPEFYKRFLPYRFMLIHQTDVFIFEDKLNEWCEKNYDYVGPPWTDTAWMYELGAKWHIPFLHRLLKKVGNGGFSLRKISKFYFYSRLYRFATARMKLNEDVIWSNHPFSFKPFFNIPSFRESLEFGFEMHPRACFEATGHLPFGAHAWQKHDTDFWKPVFAELGYEF